MTSPASDRVRVRRLPERGRYERAEVHAVLDAGFVCHLGFVVDDQPYVIPTLYGRDGDTLVVHGSSASRALRTAKTLPVCVTVTHVDGIVLARSMFHHSANYRSVVVLAEAVEVTEPEAKQHWLRVLTEHLIPGRWDEARSPNAKELRATSVLVLDLAEASVKVRSGPPGDEEEDLALDVWSGVLPLSVTVDRPVPDPTLRDGIAVPESAARWRPDGARHSHRRGS